LQNKRNLLTLPAVADYKIRCIMAYVINEDCTACGTCIDECPVEAISEGDIYKINAEVCTDCGACADVCPVEAIHPA
jgi:ferredoxin